MHLADADVARVFVFSRARAGLLWGRVESYGSRFLGGAMRKTWLGSLGLLVLVAASGCDDGTGTSSAGGAGGATSSTGTKMTTTSSTMTTTTTTSAVSSTSSGPSCGDGTADPNEDCDGGDLNGETCVSQGFGAGNLACTASCTFDTSGCDPCGNAALDGNEPCDGMNLDGEDCVSQGFGSGTLACAADCSAFDTSACDPCGNGAVDMGEACDGANLGTADCLSQGWGPGTLGCSSDCLTFDFSNCDPCGNAMIDGTEECDGMNLNAATCTSLGFDVGMLSCGANCTFDATGCASENCVNGVDDTNDMAVDCADPFCTTDCADACNAPQTLVDGAAPVAGTTTGHADLTDDKCFTGGGGGPEVIYTITPTTTGKLVITLKSPNVDLAVSVRTVCGDGNSEVACNDTAFPGSGTNPDTETLTVNATAGVPVLVMVEGFGTNDAGAYTIQAVSRAIVCNDGILDSPPESCDGSNLVGKTCANSGYATGTLACDNQTCGFDFSGCMGCSHNKCATGTALAAGCDTCVAQVCAANPTCCTGTWTAACVTAVNTVCGAGTCPTCGDAVVSVGEHCDGMNFGGKTCVTQGFTGGNLACNTCTMSTTACTGLPAATETEQNGTFQTANPYMTALRANITPPVAAVRDFDFFAVNLVAGQKITATVQDQGGANTCLGLTLDSDIALLATDGTTQLAFNDDISAQNNWCSSLTFTVTVSGTYFVRVRASQAFAGASAFPYILSVTAN